MKFFNEDKYLEQLEKEEKWEKARKYLYDKWENNKGDVDATLRLGTECWYVLSMWDCCIDTTELNIGDFQNTLKEVTEDGLVRFKNNILFLSIFGHMTSILPYLFYTKSIEKLFLEWEEKGKNMIKKAYDMDKNNLVAKLFILGFNTLEEISKIEYLEIQSKINDKINNFFSGNTEIEKYFREILLINPYE